LASLDWTYTPEFNFFLKIKDEEFGHFNQNLNGKVAPSLTNVGVDSTFVSTVILFIALAVPKTFFYDTNRTYN
jgi:hypothetical protein